MGMRGIVNQSQVAFRFGDPAYQFYGRGRTGRLHHPVQVAANQALRDGERGLGVEVAWQNIHCVPFRLLAWWTANRPVGAGCYANPRFGYLVFGYLVLEGSVARIVLNGVGRLGKAIVAAAGAPEATARVVAGVDQHLGSDIQAMTGAALPIPLYPDLEEVPQSFDVLIDASKPDALSGVLAYAVEEGKPLVIAATGHNQEQLDQIGVAARQIPVLLSSNLSIGVNVLRALTADATRMLGDVDVEVVETHHRMKVDAPSGTALTLAEAVRDASVEERDFVYGRSPDTPGARGNEIGVHALRGGTVVGEHSVTFYLDDEIVELRHVASSREVFGFGALAAANFIAGQTPGLYSMADMLGEQNLSGDVSDGDKDA